MIAGNGDQLLGIYEDADGLPPFVVHFKNGTGRFKKAEGTADLNWETEITTDYFQPFRWWASIEGSIGYWVGLWRTRTGYRTAGSMVFGPLVGAAPSPSAAIHYYAWPSPLNGLTIPAYEADKFQHKIE